MRTGTEHAGVPLLPKQALARDSPGAVFCTPEARYINAAARLSIRVSQKSQNGDRHSETPRPGFESWENKYCEVLLDFDYIYW